MSAAPAPRFGDAAKIASIRGGRMPTLARIETVVREQLGPTRDQERNQAEPYRTNRHVAIWLQRALTRASFPQIGRHWSGLHHSSVIHAVRHIDALRVADAHLAGLLDDLIAMLREQPVQRRLAAAGGALVGVDIEHLADLVAERVIARLSQQFEAAQILARKESGGDHLEEQGLTAKPHAMRRLNEVSVFAVDEEDD